MTDILLPQLGETIHEGTITRWLKLPGESVERDEPLYEVSTDKVDTEVPAPSAGKVVEILVPEGETVEVGTLLAKLSGDDAGAGAPAGESAPESDSQEVDDGDVSEAVEEEGLDEEDSVSEDSASSSESPAPSTPSTPPKSATATAAAAAAATTTPHGSAHASPVIRRYLRQHNIDLAAVRGTGPRGRITRADAEAAVAQATTVGAAPPTATTPDGETHIMSNASAESMVVPLSRIRQAIGSHMVHSKNVSPHVLTAVEVDFENVENARRANREKWKQEEGFSLTYLPFIARAVCDALDAYPHVNASIEGDNLLVHRSVNLAVAVDLDFQGLLAPVIAGAEDLRLRAIARKVVDLSRRARTNKLNPAELSGGTFTLTNPGQWGTLMQFPIINQPQVAILSTDGIKRKPVVVTDPHGSESIAIHSVGVLALAWDHRAFDGAYVAAFLDELRDIIQTRNWEEELS